MSTDPAVALELQTCQDSDGGPEASQCLQVFEFKDFAGPCAHCLHASKVTEHEERERRLALPYCHGCSAVIRNLKGLFCGKCTKEKAALASSGSSGGAASGDLSGSASGAASASGLAASGVSALQLGINTLQQIQSEGRSVASQGRFRKDARHPSIPLTNLSLNAAKSNAADPSRIRLMIIPAAFKGNKIVEVPLLGLYDKTPREDEMFEDHISGALREANTEWEQGSGDSLEREDVTPRWYGGNASTIEGSTAGDLGQFYRIHHLQANPAPYMHYPPQRMGKSFTIKSRFMVLYLLIRVAEFEDRTGCTAPLYIPGTTARLTKKRGRESDGNSSRNVSATMPSLRAPLVSQFSTTSKPCSITYLRLANITAQVEMFKSVVTMIDWENNEDPVPAKLEHVPFASGNVKQVYNLVLEDSLYVAKRMFQCTPSFESINNMVPMADNTREMELEVKRTHLIKFFLDWFFFSARKAGVDVKTATPLDVTLVRLAMETEAPASAESSTFPSLASGIDDTVWQAVTESDSSAPRITWLLEPRRPGAAVKKWSGSNIHVSQPNKKLGGILTAFAHFVYQMSNTNYVLADIQTATGRNKAGQISELLFDTCVHSAEKDFGLTDFGRDGIQAFIDQHVCNSRCQQLGLMSLEEVEEEED